jgi:hypothetical protein
MFIESRRLPLFLRHPFLLLLPSPFFHVRKHDVLDMPRILVLHQVSLPFLQDLGNQRGDFGFVPEFTDRGEEGFEVEDDGSGEREPAEGLPVDPQVAVGELEVRVLGQSMQFMRIAWRHIQWLLDLQTPRTALDGLVGWHFGEEARYGDPYY